jgi:ABC-2 type transport system ATP-binding protein
MDPVVVENLHKSYGDVHAVRGVSFSIAQGEVFGLLGPNGAGKSTTVEMIEGLRLPDQGSIRVCGLDPCRQSRRAKAHLGIQLQQSQLPPRLRVFEALRLFASFHRRSQPLEKVLHLVGLQEHRDVAYGQLSGGLKQRLALALALLHDPEVLILDEPAAGLDPQARRDLHRMILQLREDGRSILLTTHNMEEAERLCNRVAILKSGQLLAQGEPRKLVHQAGSSRVEVETQKPLAEVAVRGLPCIESYRLDGRLLLLWTHTTHQAVAAVLAMVEEDHQELTQLKVTPPSLEDLLLHLTSSGPHEEPS